MSKQENKFGVYDPVTKIFYTLPVSSQEEFNKFMQTAGLFQDCSKSQQVSKCQTFELFDDFDSVVEEVKKTPLGISSQVLMEYDF